MQDEWIDTRYFFRFERVGQAARTERGLLAEVEDELLRIDAFRDDILRVKISRGKVFDEAPTFAFRRGAYCRTDFRVLRSGDTLAVEATVSGNGCPEFARQELLVSCHGGGVKHVSVNGQDTAVAGGVLRMSNSGQSFSLTAESAGSAHIPPAIVPA